MEIGLIADTHMNIFRRYNSFFEHVEKAFELFIDECKKRNVKHIIIPGDLFHTKNYISTEAILKANEIIRNLSSLAQIYMISGNHDKVKNDNEEINLLNNYKYYDNVYIFNDYVSIKIGNKHFHFLPYHNETILKEKLINIQPSDGDILISHFGTHGFFLHENASYGYADADSQIRFNDLMKFNKVFLGHYHGYQTRILDTCEITYVSSPFQSRHGDEHGKHGFVFYNTDLNTHEFVENEFSPKFVTMKFTKENIKDLMSYKNHFIRLEIDQHVSKELLMAVKHRLLKDNFDVDYKFDIISNDAKFATIEGWDNIVYTTTDDLFVGFIRNLITKNILPAKFTEIELLDEILK